MRASVVGQVIDLATPVGARLHRTAHLMVIEAAQPLLVVSTAVLGGGMRLGRCIVALRVPSDYSGHDPAGDIRNAATLDGWVADVGLMTAVPLERARMAGISAEGVKATAIVTAGVTRPWAAGSSRAPFPTAGTINIIVLLDAGLTPAAALNVMSTMTEAKVLTLVEAGIRTPAGDLASGTATDALVVAWPQAAKGAVWKFGGPATPPGWAAAAATRGALRQALESWDE